MKDYNTKTECDPNRVKGPIYRGEEISTIEKFLKYKTSYITSKKELDNEYIKYTELKNEVERLDSLICVKKIDFDVFKARHSIIFNKKLYYDLHTQIVDLEADRYVKNIYLIQSACKLTNLESEIDYSHKWCLYCYRELDEMINELDSWGLEYLFRKYNIELPKSDNNFFDENLEMKKILKDYLDIDMHIILENQPVKSLVK